MMVRHPLSPEEGQRLEAELYNIRDGFRAAGQPCVDGFAGE